MFSWLAGSKTSSSPAPVLSDAQHLMYRSEKEENFRWLAALLATRSPRQLTAADFVPEPLHHELAMLGQFAEVAHGCMSPPFIWRHIALLCKPDFPLAGYDALPTSHLVSVFHGTVASVQGYVAHRPAHRQVLVAFSGTSSPAQALRDLDIRPVSYPAVPRAAVHSGFWGMYCGVKDVAMATLRDACKSSDDLLEIAVTGHSLGAALAYFFILDLLTCALRASSENWQPPRGVHFKMIAFGSPRIGNKTFAQHYRDCVAQYRDGTERGKGQFHEYSVKGYNDGVPAMPPNILGFRHLTVTPYYLHHGCLYQIPASECEHSLFTVVHDEDGYSSRSPDYPWGGHNYYNSRDMEKCQRRMRWFDVRETVEEVLETSYLKRLADEATSKPSSCLLRWI